jgi:hypothetical protein
VPVTFDFGNLARYHSGLLLRHSIRRLRFNASRLLFLCLQQTSLFKPFKHNKPELATLTSISLFCLKVSVLASLRTISLVLLS